MDCFSIEQVLALLSAAKAESEEDWLMLAVTFLYAMRAHEVVGLKGDNVVGEYLVRSRGKGSEPIRRPIREHVNPLLSIKKPLLRLARIKGKSKLFPISARTLQRRVHKYGKLAGLPDLLCHPHTLKHSILTYLAETMSLRDIQEISGHKELSSLGIYLHPKAEKVEKAFEDAMRGL